MTAAATSDATLRWECGPFVIVNHTVYGSPAFGTKV
jgi:hypothetical protein